MEPVLRMLSETEYITGEKICAQLGMTRAAVWKRIEKLRGEGYQIESAGKRGYLLIPKPNSLLPGYCLKSLQTSWAGQGEICYAYGMDSTNTTLKEMAREGAPQGSMALCEVQWKGRGRLNRTWEAMQEENLMQSLLLRPTLPVEQAALCTLAAAVAMAKAVEETAEGIAVRIKWPNDLVIGKRKFVGILSEMEADMDGIRFIVMGIGVNVNQKSFAGELAEKATSMWVEKSHALGEEPPPLDRQALLRSYLHWMEAAMAALEKDGLKGILTEYTRRSVTLGHMVRVMDGKESFTGKAEALDEVGALWVRDEQGKRRRVLSGDVSVRGVMGYVEG